MGRWRRERKKSALSIILAAAFCLLLTPALAAAGTIEGKVTAASTAEPIEGITVCAYGGAGSCTTSGASGEYSIAGLEAGSYKVEFNGIESGLNYITQYYKNRATFEKAQFVNVTAESTASGIDAAMKEGGQITGTVTDEGSSEPIGGVAVCAFVIGTDILSCDDTDAAGAYDVIGLPTNSSYRVEFVASGYEVEFYDDKLGLFESNPVAVTAGVVTPGIDARLAP